MSYRVTLIPGDGIGPEVVAATRRAIEATGVAVAWDRQEIGAGAFARTGSPLPEATLSSIRANMVALKGPADTPVTSGLRSVNVELRRELDLFANVRPCRHLYGVPSVYGEVDLVVIRENTEDSYTGFEFEMGTPAVAELGRFIEGVTGTRIRDDAGVSIKAITERGSERIVRFAFAYAKTFGRTKVTAGHKANIMKLSDGLFLDVARRVASEHPEVPFDDRIIDALCMQLVQSPSAFDVLVLPNMYGDMVSELGAGLIGGITVAPGGHFGGADGREMAVFEATHGTAASLAGTDVANPVGLLLSGAMLLRFLGEDDRAERLERAVASTLAAGEVTADLVSEDSHVLGTRAFTDSVISRLGMSASVA
jgi:isocitrate dehydrogenase (NAD+)